MNLATLKKLNIRVILIESDLDVTAPKGTLTPSIVAMLKQHKAEIIKELQTHLNYWLEQVRECSTETAIFSLLEQFRPLSWTDEQRAAVSQAYIRRLNVLRQ